MLRTRDFGVMNRSSPDLVAHGADEAAGSRGVGNLGGQLPQEPIQFVPALQCDDSAMLLFDDDVGDRPQTLRELRPDDFFQFLRWRQSGPSGATPRDRLDDGARCRRRGS